MQQLRVRDLRNIREARLDLGPGLNVFVGKNGQGKTSLLEAVGLVARGRSFRTDDATSVIRRGAGSLVASAATHDERDAELEVQLRPGRRAFGINGREVRPGEYHGRLDVVVYSSERLRVIHGTMRDRLQFLDDACIPLAAPCPSLSRPSRLLGDIVISVPKTEKQSKDYGTTFHEELLRLLEPYRKAVP